MGLAIGVSAAFYGLCFRAGFSSVSAFLLFLSLINLGLNLMGALVVSTPREKLFNVSWKRMIWQKKAAPPESKEPLVANSSEDVSRNDDGPTSPGSEIAQAVETKFFSLFVACSNVCLL